MTVTPERLVTELENMGVRIVGRNIVSPFNMRDLPSKDARINFLIETCGYKLADEKAFTRRNRRVNLRN
jgi:hypothetical protein